MLYSEISINRVDDTVVHCDLVHIQIESKWIDSLNWSFCNRQCIYMFIYFPIGNLMEIHMQELLICGRFQLNDGQSQAPSFDPRLIPHTMHVHTCMHVYMHAFMHAYIHERIHARIHARITMYAHERHRSQQSNNSCWTYMYQQPMTILFSFLNLA